ncbi:MAG: GDSL-type esterase/lipase family protein [Caulobacteraceae bacterium]
MKPTVQHFRMVVLLLTVAVGPVVADAARLPFADELRRFAELDRDAPEPTCGIVFVGDSSIRLWTSLKADMAPLPVINRGFGGAEISDVNRNFGRLVSRHLPRAIVFYAGENDLSDGTSPRTAFARFRRFMALKTRRLGDVPVYFISVNPSPLRFDELPLQSNLNDKVLGLSFKRPDLYFIDVVKPMLEDGQPKDIYIYDGLHMDEDGYAIWKDVVGAKLRQTGVAQRPCPKPPFLTWPGRIDRPLRRPAGPAARLPLAPRLSLTKRHATAGRLAH